MNVKEGEKISKYLGLATELKKLSKMKVTVILIKNWDLGPVLKNHKKILDEPEIKERL